MRRLSLVLPLLLVASCEVPTPLAPAEPIGEFPTWGQDFGTPAQQGPSMLAPPMAGGGGAGGGAGGAQMPGAIKDFSNGDVALGKGVFTALCARCHGERGEGGALPGGAMVPALADAKWQAATPDRQIARTIALGKGAMPAMMQQLDRDKLAGVIAYIRTLKPADSGW